MSTEEIYQNIIEEAESLEQELIKLRREFHQYPEPGWMEMRTSARIAELLESYGCDQVLMGTEVCKADARMGVPEESLLEQHYREVNALGQVSEEKLKKTRGGFTGVIGILHGKLSEERTASEKASERASENQVLAFRFDIDALPVTECENMDHFPEKQGFRSICPGYMHACGHDNHIAMLLGAAKVLNAHKAEIKGNVRLLFQTAEELSKGAEIMIKDGAMDGVDAVFGQHIGSIINKDIPAGKVIVTPGCCMASFDRFVIHVKGTGCHGSTPEKGTDPITMASHIVINLQEIIAREVSAVKAAVVTIGYFHGGVAYNAIPSEVEIEGTIRALEEPIRQYLAKRIEEIAKSTAATFRGTAEVEMDWGAPPVINNDEMAALVTEAAKEVVGEEDVVSKVPAPNMAGEDFAYYLQKVPGAFFFLSSSNPVKHTDVPHHNPHFNVDEDVLYKGSAMFVKIVEDYLG